MLLQVLSYGAMRFLGETIGTLGTVRLPSEFHEFFVMFVGGPPWFILDLVTNHDEVLHATGLAIYEPNFSLNRALFTL